MTDGLTSEDLEAIGGLLDSRLNAKMEVVNSKLDALSDRCVRIEAHAQHTNGDVTDLKKWRIQRDAIDNERARVADLERDVRRDRGITERGEKQYKLSKVEARVNVPATMVATMIAVLSLLFAVHLF